MLNPLTKVPFRSISPAERRLRAARERYTKAKTAWTRAAVHVWLGRGSSEEEVGKALAELNAARRLLSALEATP